MASTNPPGAREQRRVGAQSERFRQIVAAFAGSATAGRILPALLPRHNNQSFCTAPVPSGGGGGAVGRHLGVAVNRKGFDLRDIQELGLLRADTT